MRYLDGIVSVIIAVYNVENYLPRCLISVVSQTYKNLDIIIIDDGSIDNSSLICDEFAKVDKRITVIHQKNKGLVEARKKGLEVAKGEFISFIDGDDWIENDAYQKLVETIRNEDVDIVETGFFFDKANSTEKIELEEEKIIVDSKSKYNIYMNILRKENKKFFHNAVNKLYRRDLVLKAYSNVPSKMQHGEDLLNYLFCIQRAKKIYRFNYVFYHYVYREKSISKRNDISELVDEVNLWKMVGEIIRLDEDAISQKIIDEVVLSKTVLAINLVSKTKLNYYFYRTPHMFDDKKIIVYGAGNVGSDYVSQLSRYEKCTIVDWIDKDYERYQYDYRKVNSPQVLLCADYDYIVIAVYQETLANKIIDLLKEMNIDQEKIIWDKPITYGMLI